MLDARSPTAADEPEETQDAEADVDREIDITQALRIPMAKGVELLIAKDVAVPSRRSLVDIAMLVRKLFGLE